MPQQPKRASALETLRPLIQAADGLTLSQVCAITQLEPSTIQNWVKRGFVARPVNKKYRERQLARMMLIDRIRECMRIESIGELMKMVNGSANDESDDIISEEALLDDFDTVMARIGEAPDAREIDAAVSDVISDYIPPSENAYQRLHDALSVMVNASVAASYKRKAEEQFEVMKKIWL